MAQSSNVIKMRPECLEDEALRLFYKRLRFVEKMRAGRLTESEIMRTEADLQTDMLAVAKRYGI